MNPRYIVVASRAGHRCEYCRAPEAVFNFPFEVEHVIPLGLSGSDSEENWALACRSCNLFKSDVLEATDPETGLAVALFHPRRDEDWHHHFAVDAETGILHGLTPPGRATVTQLRMNTPFQVQARKQWTRLGLFP